MPIYALTDDVTLHPLYFAKVGRALDCLRRVDSRRYRRLRQDVKRIVVSGVEGSHYDSATDAIVLKWKKIAHKTAEQNATTLVHEAAHARIEKWGVPYEHELRARIEKACVTQQAAFARRLPDGESLAQRSMERLNSPWWTDHKMLERDLADLRDMGTPEWLVRLSERFRQARLARAARKRRDQDSDNRGSE